ncbi:hypothetical protein K438DRAFT_1777660 [Mycena galopus ATCC 62051]|nr:hypothetical protein K438DRAFT_1777660 [Mycena galopus ATCC 62051]
MPRQSTVFEMRVENITACLSLALPLLNELNDAFGPPFIQSISNTVEALINLIMLMDNTHQVLWAVIDLHVKAEIVGSLPPSMLDNIGSSTETLHKIYNFMEAHQEGSKIKHLFHDSEVNKLLQDCHEGLNQVMKALKLQAGTETLDGIREFKNKADLMHRELIELIERISDPTTVLERSSLWGALNQMQPKIFHGREQELDSLLKLLSVPSPRIAILGGGGMGKTSLAKAVLHHPDTSSKFQHTFFVSTEAATTSVELVTLVGLHVGLDPSRDLNKSVVKYFARKQSCLLILDNLETVWEPIQSRNRVEEFLSLLSEVEHLAIIVTMRGAERPSKVQWTHPFLLPLQPLSDDAARQTFIDIADNSNTYEEVTQLLEFTDNMPLAVDLMAHLADYEGFSNVLVRWETEKTSLLSVGFDRQSSLDASISLSLSSPQLTSGSKELLSLLAILPNGLSDVELVQSQLGIPNILSCKAVLQATSLIYEDRNKQFLLLMPVREYIQQFMPASQSHIQAIREHFYALLRLWKKCNGGPRQPVANEITLNLANLHEVLKQGLCPSAETLADTILCALSLNGFCRITGHSSTLLMDHIPPLVSELHGMELKAAYLAEALRTPRCRTLVSKDTIAQAQAMNFYHMALASAKQSENSNQQCEILLYMTHLECSAGNYAVGKTYASAAQKLSKLSGNLYIEATAIRHVAACSTALAQYQEGSAQLGIARGLIQICGLCGGALDHSIMVALGVIHQLKSEYSQAKHIYCQEIEATSATQNDFTYAYALLYTAQIDVMIGGPREDVYHSLDTARESAKLNSRGDIPVQCDLVHAKMELREKKFEAAYNKLSLADIKAWPVSQSQHKWPPIYLGYAQKCKDKLGLHRALLFLGDVFIANKDESTGQNLYQAALTGFTHMDVHHDRALCMLRLGDLANKQGQPFEAITLWRAAQPLFVRSSQVKDVAEIDSRVECTVKTHQKALIQLEILHAPIQLISKEEFSEVTTQDFNQDGGEGEMPVPV